MPNREVSNFVVWSRSATTMPIWTSRVSCIPGGKEDDKFDRMLSARVIEPDNLRPRGGSLRSPSTMRPTLKTKLDRRSHRALPLGREEYWTSTSASAFLGQIAGRP